MDNGRMLNEIRKATEMGQIGIDSVLDLHTDAALRQALTQQHREYGEIYKQADSLLGKAGEKKENLSPLAKTCAKMAAQMKHSADGSTARVAEMMVEGNTKGLLKSFRCRRRLTELSQETRSLAQKLLQTEVHNIEQMKQFL